MSNAIVQKPYEMTTTIRFYNSGDAMAMFRELRDRLWTPTMTFDMTNRCYVVSAECQDYVMRMVANDVNVPTEI